MTKPRSVPDQPARDLIRERLDINLLVEAGAGSGKTECLAQRMAAGVLEGRYTVEQMAAVTFTRKAAAELRASGETRPVALGVESRVNINQQLREKPTVPAMADQVQEELRGILRAVHLDKDWLEVVVEGVSMHVVGLQDAVDDVIGPMVNRSVVVRVVRASQGRLTFLDIELVD